MVFDRGQAPDCALTVKIKADSRLKEGKFDQFKNFLFLVIVAILDGCWTSLIQYKLRTTQVVHLTSINLLKKILKNPVFKSTIIFLDVY